jgi:hypothetical protein
MEGYSGEEKDIRLGRLVIDFITAELVRAADKVTNADFSSYRRFITNTYWSDTKKEKLLKTSYYSSKRDNTSTCSTTDDQAKKKMGNVMIWRSLRCHTTQASSSGTSAPTSASAASLRSTSAAGIRILCSLQLLFSQRTVFSSYNNQHKHQRKLNFSISKQTIYSLKP